MRRLSAVFLCALAAAQRTPTGAARLDRIRLLMATNLLHLPNYTCLMTVDRSVKPSGRGTLLAHEDTVRLEIAEVGDKELLGWPGSKLSEDRMENMVGRGLIASGDFSGIPNVVFRTREPRFELVGEKKLHGRDAVEYAFHVDRAVSRYEVSNRQVKMIVGYRGFFWADPQSLELLRLETVIEDFPPSLEMKRAITVTDYQKSHIGD